MVILTCENSPQDRITVHSSSILMVCIYRIFSDFSSQVAKEQANNIRFEVTNLNVYFDHYQCFSCMVKVHMTHLHLLYFRQVQSLETKKVK